MIDIYIYIYIYHKEQVQKVRWNFSAVLLQKFGFIYTIIMDGVTVHK